MQKELFNQAKDDGPAFDEQDDLFQDYEEHHHGAHHGHHHMETEEEKQTSERFLSFLLGEEGEERIFSQNIMEEIVTFILSQPDYRLLRFL